MGRRESRHKQLLDGLKENKIPEIEKDALIAFFGELSTIGKTVCPIVLPRSSVHTQ